MPRLFVALEVPSEQLLTIVPLPPNQPPHVTLRFLGDVPIDRVDALPPPLAEVADRTSPFPFRLRGIGAFPSGRRPRVVWVGFGEGAEHVERLAADVAEALVDAGFEGESRRFVPHVTLFRVRGPRHAARARELIALHPATEFGGAIALEIVLKESLLEPEGATHRTVQRFPFRGTPAPVALTSP